MNRYNFGSRDIYRHENGDWVMYDDVAEMTRKFEALRNEVLAWREWHNKEQEIFVEEPLLYQAAINASRNTDTLKALENKQ